MSEILTLHTDRLILRPNGADPRDGPDCTRVILESMNEIRPFAPWVGEPEDHSVDKMTDLANSQFQMYLAGTDLFMTVRENENGHPGEWATTVELYKIDKERGICSTGYWTPTAMTRKGYTKEALSALLQYGVDVLKLKSIYATCQRVNEPSEHILRSLGFVEIQPEEAPEGHRTDDPVKNFQFVLRK